MNYLSKQLWILLVQNDIQKPRCGTWCVHCYWNTAAPRHSHCALWTELVYVCMHMHVSAHTRKACILNWYYFYIYWYLLKSMCPHQSFWLKSNMAGFILAVSSLIIFVTPFPNSKSCWFPLSRTYMLRFPHLWLLLSCSPTRTLPPILGCDTTHQTLPQCDGLLSILGLWRPWPGLQHLTLLCPFTD